MDIDHIEENEEMSFEDFKNENGMPYWWATHMMVMLGYNDMRAFQKVIDRANKALLSLGISIYDNIIRETREVDGKLIDDYKLSRFACYLIAMNGNPKKPEVAAAQNYFVQQTRKFEIYIEKHTEIDRLLTREELIEGNKSLSSVIKDAGIEDYPKFHNAGYIGMYNMENWRLAKRRRIHKDKLLDHMGRAELAANLFRVTQTEERIKSQKIKGQKNLEDTHYKVGREVREFVQNNVGKSPEDFPPEKQIGDIKKELKQGERKMLKEDKSKKRKK